MQIQQFTYLLQNPEAISNTHTNALALCLKQYPFLQAAHALYLKALKNNKSFKYNNALKKTAAYTTDRSVLFDFITSDVFNQNKISNKLKHSTEFLKRTNVEDYRDISVNKNVLLDDELQQQIKSTQGVLDSNLFQEKHPKHDNTELDAASIHEEVDSNKYITEEKLQIGKPLEFDKTENHSFLEWLKLTKIKPINRADKEYTSKPHLAPLDQKMAIIDKFIEENPKIKPLSNATFQQPIKIESGIQDNIMTETLARIYLEQKNYDKAIKAYRILSLKYPEKSIFFADQIKLINNLKDQI